VATTFRNKKNHPLGVGTLNTAIDDNDLTIVLDAGQGASFPSATFTISIDEEIILIDSRSTDTLTVNASGRGYDSSTASAHAAGVAIANNQIVKDFTDCETAINGIENGTTTLAKVISSGSAANSHTVTDAGTNTVVSLLELYHMSSGTPAAGLGAKLILGAEDAAGTATAAMELHGYLSVVTNGAEYGEALLRVMYNGSQKTVAKFTGLATGSAIFYDTPLVLDTTAAGTGACWFIMGPAGTNRHWGRLFTGNNATTGRRWDFYANDTAESGSNAGTDVRLGAYDDSGTWIDDPIQIVRAAGGAFTTPRPFVSTSTITARSSTVGDITMGLQTTNLQLIEQYSTDGSSAAFIGLKGRGTKSSPSAVQSGDGLFFLGARNYAEPSTNIAAYRLIATETYSGAGRGTGFSVETCVAGSTSRLARIGSDSAGLIYVKQGGSTDQAKVGGVVYVSNTTVGNVGTGEDDLMSASISAATLETNTQCLCFEAHFTTAANANNKTVKIKFGATTIYDSTAVAANDDRLHVHGVIYRTGAATQIARVTAIGNNGGAFLNDVQFSSPTETLSGAITFKATCAGTSDNDVQMTDMRLWWAPNNT